jgi:hypothetical protein
MSYFGTYGLTEQEKQALRERAEGEWAKLEGGGGAAPELKGIAYPVDINAKGAEVKTIQEALVFLGYLDASDVKSPYKYTSKTGLALKKFLQDRGGWPSGCASVSESGSSGCKRVDSSLAEKLDAALAERGASASTGLQGLTGFLFGTGEEAPEGEKTCTEELSWWQGMAIGAGVITDPCPPPGSSTGNTATDQALIAIETCNAWKASKPQKIAISGVVGGLSGALMGMAFAQEKGKGAALGAIAVGILGAGLYAALQPGKPQGCE